jgi:septal ring factor EnvC (AmiA/AmiB activator)
VFRNLAIFLALLYLPLATLAQTRDTRVDALVADVAQLKHTIADQEQKIADLEKAVKALQTAAAPVPQRIPAPTPAWQVASNWNLIKTGMSAAQVI